MKVPPLQLFPRLPLPLNLNTKGVSYLVPFPMGQITGKKGHGEAWPSPIVLWDLRACRAYTYSSAFFIGVMCVHLHQKACGFPHCLTAGKFCLILEDRKKGHCCQILKPHSPVALVVITLPFRIKKSTMWIPNGGELLGYRIYNTALGF